MKHHQSSAGLVFGLFIMTVIGLALIIGPFFVPEIQGVGKTALAIIGAITLFLGTIGLVITKLYVRTKPDQVFVRTGSGGSQVIQDGGSIVIPVIHTIKFVPLNTMRIDVERSGSDALLTADKLRARIKANFYIAIPKEKEMILKAAATLPDVSTGGTMEVQKLIEEKLIGALRTVAAQKTLEELNSDRAAFAEAVQKIVAEELKPNGLQLESVNISGLDQEDPSSMDPDNNVFDAEGMKTITTITATNRIKRAEIDADAAMKVKDREVAKQMYLASKDREMTETVAAETQTAERARISAETETRKRQATLDSEANIVAAEQRQAAEIKRVEADRTVAIAEAEMNKDVQVKQQETLQAAQVAAVEAAQATEIANRQREIAVAEAETARANADALRLNAEESRAHADQAVQTTVAVETAKRQSEQAIIAKSADARQQQIEQNMAADVKAYTIKVEAEAQKDAATNNAEARLIQAKATQEAAELEAKGQQAVALVPVEVKAREVEVEAKSVAVLRSRLEAESENSAVAVNRDLGLAFITAWKESEIAKANAMGESLKSAKMTIWGDSQSMEKITGAFLSGQRAGFMTDGFMDSVPPLIKNALEGLSNVAEIAKLVRKPSSGDAPGADKGDVKSVVEPAQGSTAPEQKSKSKS